MKTSAGKNSAATTKAAPTKVPAKAATKTVTKASAKTVKPAAADKISASAAPAAAVEVKPKASYVSTLPVAPVTPTTTVIKKDTKLANNWKTKPPHELTDAELLSMSDDDYMNDAQLAAFKHRLVQLKEGILSSAGKTTEHLREDTVVVPDPADRATIEEEHALELRTRDRERKLLKKIEQSIARIDAGDYGYCDETGEPIGVGRLLARPTATLSLEAQQRRELKQKMFGD